MRLLNVQTYELKDVRQNVAYAILSHRWYDEEITLRSLNPAQLKDAGQQSPQLDKIRGACSRAKEDKLEWIWIDSCCIDKTSSQEVNQLINSMFQWHQQAAVCYTYLSDVVTATPGAKLFEARKTETGPKRKYSEWFERGWTLQELLAPRTMRFFDREWKLIGTRAELAMDISRITGIDTQYLNGADTFRNASIATRLSWQAGRRTTEVEDIAYSLVGVLGIHLVPIYGEGRLAFQRLQKEILGTLPDESIFAWTAPAESLPGHSRPWASGQWGLLAPSVDCFMNSRDITINGPSKRRPPCGITSTAEGVKFPMPKKDLQTIPQWTGVISVFTPPFLGPFLWWGISKYLHTQRKEFSLTLNCWRENEHGQLKAVQVFVTRDTKGDQVWRRCRCAELGSASKVPSSAVRHGHSTVTDITVLQPSGVRWLTV